ncbi:GNAT family N-acetyltransferase [Salmonella enterica subsp. enterica serovar Mikawasima]|nr:GNAT family N-acetyltransferase [Salmonella enterica subsp. enterica serovar Mikawasima]
MEVVYQVVVKDRITNSHRDAFAEMLKAQGKVQGDLATKADRCMAICFAFYNDELAAIGAIKCKTVSDFSAHKADLISLEPKFDWELGYIYTVPKFEGKGLARNVVAILLESFGKGNLMASTEITENPGMVHILERNGFKLYGKPWKSAIHGNYLGLYLKFK